MKKLPLLALSVVILTNLSLPLLSFAQNKFDPKQIGTGNIQPIPDTISTPGALVLLVNKIGSWIFTVFLVVAVIFILLAAFEYLTAKGEAEDIKKAHKMLIYSAVAVAVALLAKGLVSVVGVLVAQKLTI